MKLHRSQLLKYLGLVLGTTIGAIAIAKRKTLFLTSSSKKPLPQFPGKRWIGTQKDLEQFGQIFNQDITCEPVLAIANPQQNNTVIAVDPTCPHHQCQVTWRRDRDRFICPCHGSIFDSEGNLLTEPATQGLKRYQVTIIENGLYIETAQ
ncbi:MAG: Rieske 2Fe-2S domain-containing protein [Cyanobacteria bacterium SBLK]|nr:Rieske 2Fe-2S domain-containing protein [Cyanobacteria bacterium SBLK]